jgi:hypothetical protein
MLKWPPERDRAARTNHYYQRGADGERGEAAHVGLDDAPADGEDREDRPDEFNKALVRSGFRFGFA